ncbi:MFS general substrate transporter [Collybia nuda]|uniref:MFS general substrate transporter n=1 Tax=Collybia nuda TaxID=64659 RepID=A0A9P6CGD6_9AGAR|nr:MFS general substrate transporter [Collybia nuda]
MSTVHLSSIVSTSSPIPDKLHDARIEKAHMALPEPVGFVEGTLRGWLTIIGGCLVAISTFGNIQSFGVFQDFYTRTYLSNETASTISWIGSIQLGLQFIVGVVSGKLFDKGYFHILMVTGSLLLLFSSFMLSLVKPHQFYQALLSQGFGMGIGMGFLFLPSLSIVSHYFRRRRAVAMGMIIASGSFGGAIYSILLNKIIAHEGLGFAWAVRFIAFINVFLLLVANLIMKPRPPTRNPEPVDMNQIWRDRPYWATNFGIFLGFWGVYIPYFYLQLFAAIQDVDDDFIAWIIPILNAGAMFGRFMPSFLADRYGPLNVLIPIGFLSGTIMWALLGVKSVAGVTVFAIFYGFFSGAFLTLSSPAVASFSTSPTMNDIGLRVGITCFFVGLALLSGNPIAGALLSPPHYFWWRPLTFGCVIILSGSFIIFLARQALVKRRGRQLL